MINDTTRITKLSQLYKECYNLSLVNIGISVGRCFWITIQAHTLKFFFNGWLTYGSLAYTSSPNLNVNFLRSSIYSKITVWDSLNTLVCNWDVVGTIIFLFSCNSLNLICSFDDGYSYLILPCFSWEKKNIMVRCLCVDFMGPSICYILTSGNIIKTLISLFYR